MKREKLAQQSDRFALRADEARSTWAGDENAQRRFESARRSLMRSIIRVCHKLTTDELIKVANYMSLISI